MSGTLRRICGIIWVVLCLFGFAVHQAWSAETVVSPDAVAPDAVTFVLQPDGGYLVTASAYTARVAGDGNMHSLRVNGVEFLDDQLPSSYGASYFDDKPIALQHLSLDGHLLQVTDGLYTLKYLCEPGGITLTLRHTNQKEVSFIAVGSAKIAFVEDLHVKTMATAPADFHWADVRLTMPTGEFLDIKGGSRIYGRQVGRQIIEAGNLAPNRDWVLKLLPGRGTPPAPALTQLTGLTISMPAADHLVPAGEEVNIQVNFTNNSNQQVNSEIALRITSSTGVTVLDERKPLSCLPHQSVVCNWKLTPANPDFYLARCSVNLEGALESARTTFGYAPSNIHLLVEKPADFASYWDRATLEARTSVVELPHPPKVDLARSTATVLVSEVGITVDGVEQFSGWLSVPKFPGKYPGLLVLPSDRVRAIGPNPALADCGFVVLSIEPTGQSVRGRLTPLIAQASKEPAKPDKIGLRAIVIRSLEAVTALSKVPQVDPNRLAVTGAGIGGGISVLLAALDERIQAVAPDVPYYCNIGVGANTTDWPYRELADYIQQHPDQKDAVLKTLQYFDVANFAASVNCPALISLGINDTYSLPNNIVSVVNQLPGPHALKVYLAHHEGGGVLHWQEKMRWLTSVLGGPGPLTSDQQPTAIKDPLTTKEPIKPVDTTAPITPALTPATPVAPPASADHAPTPDTVVSTTTAPTPPVADSIAP